LPASPPSRPANSDFLREFRQFPRIKGNEGNAGKSLAAKKHKKHKKNPSQAKWRACDFRFQVSEFSFAPFAPFCGQALALVGRASPRAGFATFFVVQPVQVSGLRFSRLAILNLLLSFFYCAFAPWRLGVEFRLNGYGSAGSRQKPFNAKVPSGEGARD
jgi:hypothetical protein